MFLLILHSNELSLRMRKIISVFKVFFFLTGTVTTYSVYAIGLLFVKLLGYNYEPWRNKIMTIWGRESAFFLSMDIETEGVPPEPPFFLVTNHLSYLDIVVLSATTKTTYVSKGEIKHWPLIGIMARTLGIIFINRTRKKDVKRVNKIISEQINERQGITVFPESMTSPGEKILPFRPSLLQHPAAEGLEVSYAAIQYQTSEKDVPAYQSVSWWGDAELYKHLILMGQNRKIKAKIKFGEKKLIDPDRKTLAMKLHQQITELFEPMADGPVKNYKPLEFNKK